MVWQNSNTKTWFKQFLKAFWNATIYNWDDAKLTWDALSDDNWNESDKTNWETQN